MKKWDLQAIMRTAWKLFRRGGISFAEALHRSWNVAKAAPMNAQIVDAAKQAAGVTEEAHSWAGWKRLGFEVIHGSKALFQAVVAAPEKGEARTFRKSYFGASQVQPLTV